MIPNILAPYASSVELVGEHSALGAIEIPLKEQAPGQWTALNSLTSGALRYQIRINGCFLIGIDDVDWLTNDSGEVICTSLISTSRRSGNSILTLDSYTLCKAIRQDNEKRFWPSKESRVFLDTDQGVFFHFQITSERYPILATLFYYSERADDLILVRNLIIPKGTERTRQVFLGMEMNPRLPLGKYKVALTIGAEVLAEDAFELRRLVPYGATGRATERR